MKSKRCWKSWRRHTSWIRNSTHCERTSDHDFRRRATTTARKAATTRTKRQKQGATLTRKKAGRRRHQTIA
eukprot:244163-Ditylum_brightwellii.AAC.1